MNPLNNHGLWKLVCFFACLSLLNIVLSSFFAQEGSSRLLAFLRRAWAPPDSLSLLPAERIQVGSESARCDVTIVTIYFRFNSSKHSANKYRRWQRKFFQSVTAAPLVVFTDRRSIAELLNMSATLSPRSSKTFYVFDEVWDITRLIERERGRPDYVHNYKHAQHQLDQEERIHTPNLYAVWNAKPFVMWHASRINTYQSKFFLYTDIGAFRSRVYPRWPDVRHLVRQAAALRHRMLFGQISQQIDDPYNSRSDHIEGTFFGGSPRALNFYYAKFYDIHDALLDNGDFVGKDQKIMNIFVLVANPERSCVLWTPDIFATCLPGVDIWFFYQLYFSASWSQAYLTGPKRICPNAPLHPPGHDDAENVDENNDLQLSHFFAGRESVSCAEASDPVAVPKCFKCRHWRRPASTSLSPRTNS